MRSKALNVALTFKFNKFHTKHNNKMLKFAALILVLVAVSLAEEPKANLIIHKSFENKYAVLNKPLIVKVRVLNVGEGAAFDVSLNDETWNKENFELTAGEFAAKWDQILPGQNVTHNFTLLPTTWGEYDPEAAVVTYKQTADAEPKTAYSTDIRPIFVYYRDSDRKEGFHALEWLVFFLLSALTIVPSYLIYTQKSSQYQVGKKRN